MTQVVAHEVAKADAGDEVFSDLLPVCAEAMAAVGELVEAARQAVLGLVSGGSGKIDAALLDSRQLATHGFAWLNTYAEGLRQMYGWGAGLREAGQFSELEQLMLQLVFGEYLAQMAGGIPLSQVEIVRPVDMSIRSSAVMAFLGTPEVGRLIGLGASAAVRFRLAELIAERRDFGRLGVGDETIDMVRDQFTRYAADKVVPLAHEWHLKDQLIPMSVIEQMAEMGVFGLTVPEEYGGLGMGKTAMCVVSEVLSCAYIGVGSLGTRSEIAAELIRLGGTEEQKAEWLPRLSSGEILPTAVFTEPNSGSDLGSLRTRAVREGDVYRIYGAKTWITHGARSDLMTLLVRTDPNTSDHRGLSMLLAEKPRGSEGDPFPVDGMTGSEIKVLGYRGMKEYEIGFDGFTVPVANLLGGVEGRGFKQLMETFESARIQTAARATGVAQNALELGLKYALERSQFGKLLIKFPRVANKIAWMAAETMMVRQLTYFAAREKDQDLRCDIEAGMAKLLAARVAWTNADSALQIHGGNGYAEEYPISRVLCDARILSVFEGAAEIQAQVIARGLLGRRG
ncbi:MAG: acyl-CoA dehydrogenase family protein [Rhodospirillaceae bacterium]